MSAQRLLTCKVELTQSIVDSEYGDIRSILDEFLFDATWSEQVDMTKHLNVLVNGALYSYTAADGWTYVEEGD
jgi:hypothetical protein